jgi:hypothetical protein
MTIALGDALEAFILERELDSDVNDDRVWMTCTCGAVIVRPSSARPCRENS